MAHHASERLQLGAPDVSHWFASVMLGEPPAVRRSYAVLWSSGGDVGSGRLEPLDDRFELHGRGRRLSIPFAGVVRASIRRGRLERLRGLPVLELEAATGEPVRIASLEGTAALLELADRVSASGHLVAL